jgi:hypothetical protein
MIRAYRGRVRPSRAVRCTECGACGAAFPGRSAARSSSRSGALQSRGPALSRTGVPVLRSSMKNAASRPRHELIITGSEHVAAFPGRSAARSSSRSGALQSRGPAFLNCNRGPGSAKQREERCIAPGKRCCNFQIQISNSQGSAFSRRNASEVCQSLAIPSEGVERREAPGHQRAPLEAGLTYPPRAARHRARPRLGAAPPGAPPTRPSTVPGRPGPASSRSVRRRTASRKRPLHRTGREQDKRGLGDGDKECEKFFRQQLQPRAPDAAQSVGRDKRSALRHSTAQCASLIAPYTATLLEEPGSRFCEAALRKSPTLHRARDTRAYIFSTRP